MDTSKFKKLFPRGIGRECGPGWNLMLNDLCSFIQHHIDESRNSRATALRFNRAVDRSCKLKCSSPLKHFYKIDSLSPGFSEYVLREISSLMVEPKFRNVPNAVPQVVVTQIKEKFGTLRFYYAGGDDYIRGLVDFAERMSEHICENCGDKGTLDTSGWHTVRCEKCRNKIND